MNTKNNTIPRPQDSFKDLDRPRIARRLICSFSVCSFGESTAGSVPTLFSGAS